MKNTQKKFNISKVLSANQTRIWKLLTVVSGIGIIGGILLLIPQIRYGLIAFAGQYIMHRPLTTDVWNRMLIEVAGRGSFVFTLALIVSIWKIVCRRQVKSGVLIFFYLAFQMAINIPSPSSNLGYIYSSYLLSYRQQGFLSRMFIGTIVDFLAGGGIITVEFIWFFVISALILYVFFVSVLLGFLIDHAKKNIRNCIVLFTIVYLSCFTSPSAYFISQQFGRMELYALIFILGAVALLEKHRCRWIIPILCLFSIATHLVVVFFYMPLVFILLLYKIFENNKSRKNAISLLIATVGVIILSAIYFVMFSKNTLLFTSEQTYTDFLRSRTDVPITEFSIHYDIYMSMREGFNELLHRMKEERLTIFGIFGGVFSILQNIPVFILFVFFWIRCILNEHRTAIKLIFILSACMPFVSIPVFLFAWDWGRWIIMIMTSQFILVFYFLYKREASVLYASELFLTTAKKHSLAFILCCALMVVIGPNGCIGPSPRFFWYLHMIGYIISKII